METLNERGNTKKTTEQQQENVKRWVAALRSGNYAQGRGCLRSADDEFCCLDLSNGFPGGRPFWGADFWIGIQLPFNI